MKRTLSVFLVFVVLMSFSYTAVLAQGTIELLEARNDVGGGVIFVFHYTGDFNANDFKGGLVILGDQNFPMNCNITDKQEGIVQCTSSRAVAGQNVRINLAGQILYAFVPARSGGSSSGGSFSLCYNIYDLFEDENGLSWQSFDTLCSDNPPSGLIDYPNPWGSTSDYNFDSQTQCYNLIVEDAYYSFCGT